MEKEKTIESFPLRLITGGILLFNCTYLAALGLLLTFPNDQWGPLEDPPPSFVGQLLLILICLPSLIGMIALLINHHTLPILLICIGVALLLWVPLLKLYSGEYFMGVEFYWLFSFLGFIFAAIGYYIKRELNRSKSTIQ